MKVAEKKKVNKAVGVVVAPTYFNEIPLADIMGAIENHGYLVVDEEHNRWSGFLCGREGQAMFDILSKETGKHGQLEPHAFLVHDAFREVRGFGLCGLRR